MVEILDADTARDRHIIKGLFVEYLTWVNINLDQKFGYRFDVLDKVEQDMAKLEMYLPPSGRLLLAAEGGQPAGIGCLRCIRDGIGEIKRMYVKPEYC